MTTEYDVVARDPGCAVIVLTGRIDREASQLISSSYERAAQSNPSTVVLDFDAVDYINSTGIALIVSLLGRARSEQRAVHASGLTDHYRHIFDITRLSDFIEVFSDVDAAVGADAS